MASSSSWAFGSRLEVSRRINVQCVLPPGGIQVEIWNRVKELRININSKRGSRGGVHRSRPQVIDSYGNIATGINNSDLGNAIPTVLSKYRRPMWFHVICNH